MVDIASFYSYKHREAFEQWQDDPATRWPTYGLITPELVYAAFEYGISLGDARKGAKRHEVEPSDSIVASPAQLGDAYNTESPASDMTDSIMLINLIKGMGIAHEMSHESFCDGAQWKDTFQGLYEKAIGAIMGTYEMKAADLHGQNLPIDKANSDAPANNEICRLIGRIEVTLDYFCTEFPQNSQAQ